MSFSPVRLNHAVLFVADLGRAERFYRDVFGMDVIAREPRANAVFLRLPRSDNTAGVVVPSRDEVRSGVP